MNAYPEVVSKVVDDYLERLKRQLRSVPSQEQGEFLREIQSHIYEAYQEHSPEYAPEDSTENRTGEEMTRILRVLRNLGEPNEVVSDRLPEAIVRKGSAWRGPLSILGGIFISIIGIPLGFGGVALLIGGLAAITGVLAAYFAASGATLLVSLMFFSLGMLRLYQPEIWDSLLSAGVIQMDAQAADFLDRLTPSAQGNLMILFAIVFGAIGVAMLWFGRDLVRGHRFFVGLILDGVRQLGKRIRTRLAGFSQSESVTNTRPFAPTAVRPS